MKVGFIVECGRDGAESKVIPHLAKKVCPTITPVVSTLDEKLNLKEKCATEAKKLLEQGCSKVLVIWDLMPGWGGEGDCKLDRQEILASLNAVGIDMASVKLICIASMIEAWLRADERALSAFLSTPEHPVSVSRHKHPDREKDAKSCLITLFKKNGKPIGYRDVDHAFKIVEKMPDLKRLEKIETFRRFKDKLLN